MEKNKILNFLTKYHLGGLVEQTIWKIDANNLIVKFRSNEKTVMGIGLLKNFKLENCEFGVYATSKMINAISPLDDEIDIELLKQDEQIYSISYKDSEANNKRAITHVGVIKNTFDEIDLPEKSFDTVIDIDSTFINKFNKIKNIEADNIAIKINKNNTATFIINYDQNNVDTGKFDVPIQQGSMTIKPHRFKLEVFSKILSANKDFEKGTLKYCTEHGIIKFLYKSDEMNMMYYSVTLI